MVFLSLTIEHAWAQPEPSARSANDWKKEWDKSIEGAKREGRVHVYMGGWGAVLDAGEFQRAYPFVKLTSVTGRGGEIAKRILAERRAGKFIADVSSEGVGSNFRTLHTAKSLDSIKAALILPR